MDSNVEINGAHLVADANAIADANIDIQCKWTPGLRKFLEKCLQISLIVKS